METMKQTELKALYGKSQGILPPSDPYINCDYWDPIFFLMYFDKRCPSPKSKTFNLFISLIPNASLFWIWFSISQARRSDLGYTLAKKTLKQLSVCLEMNAVLVNKNESQSQVSNYVANSIIHILEKSGGLSLALLIPQVVLNLACFSSCGFISSLCRCMRSFYRSVLRGLWWVQVLLQPLIAHSLSVLSMLNSF